ncbi:MAG TPA: undecaprenyldiphospho-muramoylpentapeptide beta-N-acetylglucosaminyltransferase [Vicinamibacterales bacterium]|nr:undecaprenyldiphospho-muramoylpentapeptide beta-N-acetylglucosaminyltransferase [Vicinamibacterales bacterium]
MTPPRIVIAGGGTGGHLYPGIAVAREILRRRPDAIVTFAGTARGIEARVIPREGFELDTLRSVGLKGTSAAALARGLALLPLSAIDAWRIVSRRRPDLVIGVGGYSSGPVVAIAAARRIPTLLLEQNAVPGFTNRALASVVSAAAVTFESTVGYFGRRGFVTGNPVRPEFFTEGDSNAAAGPPRVLIFGGSQGSHAINVACMEAAPRLAADGRRVAITHQTGERDLERVRDAYRRAGLDARVEPFLFAMDREIKAADLVVSRAGATTLAELTAAGRPAVLVPLPTAADDHQRKNADLLRAAGAVEVIEEKDLTGARLAARVMELTGDRDRLAEMSAAARRMARPGAAALIVDRALELANR